jgi:glycosyltransferase involved in cell wall biosynthesis
VRLVVLTSILTPYLMPLFTELNKRADRFEALLMAERSEDRLWNLSSSSFSYRILPGLHIRFPGRAVSNHFNCGVVRTLYSFDPDVVISGGFAPANMTAMLYCQTFRKKFIVWGELTLRDGAETSYPKRAIRRWIAGRADGAIASSGEAREAFRHYGVDDERILTAVMPVDVDHFHSGAEAFRSTQEFRGLRGRYRRPILLSVGQIIPRKGYRELFEIYRRLIEAGHEPSLVIIGDGPDRMGFEAQARDRGWREVHFHGFVPPQDLPKWFALADIFIFHTLFDPFGAVLGEAMAAGLPVVSSIHAAATHELVEEGVTGYHIDPTKPDASAAVIIKALSANLEERLVMGRAAYSKVRQYDPRASAEAIVQFVGSLSKKAGGPMRVPTGYRSGMRRD